MARVLCDDNNLTTISVVSGMGIRHILLVADLYHRFIVTVVIRGSQFAAELLVIGITWWYSYQSYRIRKGVKLGRTISSLLLYNGTFPH